jgi:hypothetical protein
MTMNSVNDRLQEATADDKYDGAVIGEVVVNDDPVGISRIKVKIPNLLDSDQGPIPWCLPSKHSPFGQGPGYGVYGTPAVGSPVRIRFQNGDPSYPIYEADEYLAAHANPKFKDPKTWGYKDPGGSELWVNYETGAWEWTHQSGDSIKYDGQGNVEIHDVANSKTTIDGNETTETKGTLTETVTGAVTTEYKSSLNFTVVGNAQINVQGSLNAQVGAGATLAVTGTTNITSTGSVNISGSSVNLN